MVLPAANQSWPGCVLSSLNWRSDCVDACKVPFRQWQVVHSLSIVDEGHTKVNDACVVGDALGTDIEHDVPWFDVSMNEP